MVYDINRLKNHISEALVSEICEMFQIIRQLKRIQASQGPARPKLTSEEIKDRHNKFRKSHPRRNLVEEGVSPAEQFLEDQLVYNEMVASGVDPFSEDGYVADGYEVDASEMKGIFTNVGSYN